MSHLFRRRPDSESLSIATPPCIICPFSPKCSPTSFRFRKGVFPNLRVAIFLFFFCGVVWRCRHRAATAPEDQDIRIDVPTGRVRIENQFGAIVASVWNEKYVSVAATIEGNTPFKRSPIVIENRDKFLTISVVRRPLDPAISIGLVVKLPASVHAEINTGSGAINISGIPASASLHSASGDIRAELQSPLNADINARSVVGVIRSTLDAPLSGAGHVLQTRLGTGENVLCGPTVDPELARISGDLAWLTAQGIEVQRFNLAQQPQAFLSNPTVTAMLRQGGEATLPLVMCDGEVIAAGRYPSREALAAAAGLVTAAAAKEPSRLRMRSKCEPGSGCCS